MRRTTMCPARAVACLVALCQAAAVAPNVAAVARDPPGASTEANVTLITDEGETSGICDLAEAFFQRAVRESCALDRAVTCVYVHFPHCSGEDICANRNGCGYVQDNDFVKFSGYSCKGSIGWARGQPTGSFELSCSPTLTPTATWLIVLGCIALVVGCACCLWCCCRHR
mmetsp:Transcript_46494/g.107302  ORF Transcript_46494/g.107302 Transcript_46494/m.107302 type:complete len:170 (-) Transcript_46494:73-582(-)